MLFQTKRYLEFGSGGSTCTAAKCLTVEQIYSVESDEQWLLRLAKVPAIRERLRQHAIHLLQADIGTTGPCGQPASALHVTKWPNYYWHIWQRINTEPDLVFVDGRFRVAVCLAACIHLKKEFQLLIHDYMRPEYHVIEEFYEKKDGVDTLALLHPKKEYDPQRLTSVLKKHMFDQR